MVTLMYHDIVTSQDRYSGFQNDSAFMYKVDAIMFEEQVKMCQSSNVVFTFDDGGDSFIKIAAPILEKYKKRGVFFVSTKYIDTKGFLSASQIVELDKRGHIIGSHSHSHPNNMSKLSTQQIKEEWTTSIEKLSTILGKRVTVASIPNGYDSNDVIDEAARAGITELYTSKPSTHTELRNGVKIIGRYVVHNSMSNEYVYRIVTKSFVRFKLHCRWQLITFLKVILGSSYNRIKSMLLR